MANPITKSEYERLFRDYYTKLYYFAYDYVADIEVGKDIVSTVFATVWNERERMEVNSLVSYLYTSVRNQCLNHLRQTNRMEEYREFCLQSQDEYSTEEEWQAMEQQIAEMQSEIEKMSPRTRYVLTECYFHDKKYKEVAEVLGVSSDGVKKHIVKAFALLREHFHVKKP